MSQQPKGFFVYVQNHKFGPYLYDEGYWMGEPGVVYKRLSTGIDQWIIVIGGPYYVMEMIY